MKWSSKMSQYVQMSRFMCINLMQGIFSTSTVRQLHILQKSPTYIHTTNAYKLSYTHSSDSENPANLILV